MKTFKLALCVGHNEKAKGALGNAGMYEWDFNTQFVGDLKDLLESIYPVLEVEIFFREPIKSYTRQMLILNEQLEAFGSDLSIEFHFNASSSPASGHEVLYCKKSPKGRKYAKLLNSSFNKFLPNKDRGIKGVTKGDRGGKFVCLGREPRLITEPFFAIEQNKFLEDENYTALLNSYVDFLTNFDEVMRMF